MKEVEKLLKLGNDLKIIKIEETNEEKIVYVESRSKKVRCPFCNSFTKSVHDKLKPMFIKDLKIYERHTKLAVMKRRFICCRCNKRFTEELNINEKTRSISNKLKLKIQLDLLDYNKSLKSIAVDNNVSDEGIF